MKKIITRFTQQLFFTANKTITEIKPIEDQSEFRKLPNELVAYIASFFDKPEELGCFAKVSNRFNRISQETMLWKRFGHESKEAYITYVKMIETQKIALGDVVKLHFLGSFNVNGQPSNKQLFFNQLRQRNEASGYKRSIGIDFDMLQLNGHRFQLWDMAGQDKFGTLLGIYLKESDI